MSKIHVLDRATIDRIAAGEVVERPASVVKELTENAIDAGSTRITIELRDGGKSLIRITDNGQGIAPDEIPIAFKRHATSKINTAEDLTGVATLGFRGEALSSIAAVSRVELITKRAEDLSASRYLIEGGRERLIEEIGAPDGTTIIVRDLFYNTPARGKFLKSSVTEASHAGEVVEQLILSHPEIAITFMLNGQTRLASSGNGDLKETVYRIYGRDVAKLVTEVNFAEDDIRVRGFIGKPQISRGNRNFESFFLDGRNIKSRLLSRASEDAYGTMLMQHQYPFVLLSISLPGEMYDVNVHPAKMEVRFYDEKAVYEAVRSAVHGALFGLEMCVTETEGAKEMAAQAETDAAAPSVRPAEPFETIASSETAPLASRAAGRLADALIMEESAPYAASSAIRDEEEGKKSGRFTQQTFVPRFLTEEARPGRRMVGDVFSTYWICEYDGKVYVFDQHAAHERVLFEKLMRAYEQREISRQELSPPLIITLSAQEEEAYLTHADAFAALGFEIEAFGERDYAVRAVPYALGTLRSDVLFHEIIDQAALTTEIADNKQYIKKVATEACKAAVKGGRKITEREAEALLDDLMRCEDPYHCPHGRPTLLTFTQADIEKRFKRI